MTFFDNFLWVGHGNFFRFRYFFTQRPASPNDPVGAQGPHGGRFTSWLPNCLILSRFRVGAKSGNSRRAFQPRGELRRILK